MLDAETGEFTEKVVRHEGNAVREFDAALEGPVVVGIEATGSMQWFLQPLEKLGIQYRVGHPAKIRAAKKNLMSLDKADIVRDVEKVRVVFKFSSGFLTVSTILYST